MIDGTPEREMSSQPARNLRDCAAAVIMVMRQTSARVLRCTGRSGFLSENHGGMAVVTALALPALVLLSLGAVQINAIVSDRSETQDVANAAALWGAQQLTVAPVGASERTRAFADAQLGLVKANSTVTVTAQVLGWSTMKVTIATHRPSFFMNLMPVGGFFTHVVATAEGVNQTPLCVMTLGAASADKLAVTGSSQISAPACLVHGNESIEVGGSASLQAKVVEAGTTASGPISPTASTGAPDVLDPFTGLNTAFPTPCTSYGSTLNITSSQALAPGVYCRPIDVSGNATLTLNPGEFYFGKDLKMNGGTKIVGNDVVLVFGKDGAPSFSNGNEVRLKGRKTGALAGFVMIATRDYVNEFKLDSDPVVEMTGTVYVPSTTFNIDGSKQTVQVSDWTVLSVKALKLSNQPQVKINANYEGSDVPVPGGVGNKVGVSRLTE